MIWLLEGPLQKHLPKHHHHRCCDGGGCRREVSFDPPSGFCSVRATVNDEIYQWNRLAGLARTSKSPTTDCDSLTLFLHRVTLPLSSLSVSVPWKRILWTNMYSQFISKQNDTIPHSLCQLHCHYQQRNQQSIQHQAYNIQPWMQRSDTWLFMILQRNEFYFFIYNVQKVNIDTAVKISALSIGVKISYVEISEVSLYWGFLRGTPMSKISASGREQLLIFGGNIRLRQRLG